MKVSRWAPTSTRYVRIETKGVDPAPQIDKDTETASPLREGFSLAGPPNCTSLPLRARSAHMLAKGFGSKPSKPKQAAHRIVPASKPCPCFSGKPYGECCKPFHEGKKLPEPVDVMRARYSAYAWCATVRVVAVRIVPFFAAPCWLSPRRLLLCAAQYLFVLVHTMLTEFGLLCETRKRSYLIVVLC